MLTFYRGDMHFGEIIDENITYHLADRALTCGLLQKIEVELWTEYSDRSSHR